MAGRYGIRPYGYDPGAFRRRSPPRRPEGWPPYIPPFRLCVGRGALTPPKVHAAARFFALLRKKVPHAFLRGALFI